MVPNLSAFCIEDTVSLSAWPKISGPQEETQSIYSFPSTSNNLLPFPFSKNIGSHPTLLKALTGEFTPPGINFLDFMNS